MSVSRVSGNAPEPSWWQRFIPLPNTEVAAPLQPSPKASSVSSFIWDLPKTFLGSQLEGKTFLVVFNPAAQDGRIQKELGSLTLHLEQAGAKVVTVATVPDPTQRQQLIFDAVQDLLKSEGITADPLSQKKIYVMPYGGDGTIWDVVEAALKASGWVTQKSNANSKSTGQSSVVFVFPNKGTAADSAYQVEGPTMASRLSEYIQGSIEVPHTVPLITAETRHKKSILNNAAAGQSFTVGTGGHLFGIRDQNKKDNPNGFLNKGILSYLRLLPRAAIDPIGLFGFRVELTKYNSDGEIVQKSPQMRSGEVIVTPNAIIAGVAGIPSEWGKTQIWIVPPGIHGVWTIVKSIALGLVTKLGYKQGYNLVDPKYKGWVLGPDRLWSLGPGERLEGRIFRRSGMSGILNGDTLRKIQRFTVYNPYFSIPVLSSLDSLAVQGARRSHRLNLTDAQLLAKMFPDTEGRIIASSQRANIVRSHYFSMPQLGQLPKSGLTSDKLPDLVLAAPDQETNILNPASEPTSVAQLKDFLRSEKGEAWKAQQLPSWSQGLKERSLRGGLPLGLGMAAALGAGKLSDLLGLDPERDREWRFAVMIYVGHAVQANLAPVWEVLANRALKRPYDFIRSQTLHYAGESFVRWQYFAEEGLANAMKSSWKTAMLGPELGLQAGLGGRVLSWAKLPFTAPLQMGTGLAFSNVAETLVSGSAEGSWTRDYVPTLAFFTPDLWKILHPRTATAFLNFAPVRAFARVSGYAFLGELLYFGLQKYRFGAAQTYEASVKARVAAKRRETGEIGVIGLRNGLAWVAPSISQHFESHDYWIGSESDLSLEIRDQDRRLNRQLQEFVKKDLKVFAELLKTTPEILLESKITLDPSELQILQSQAESVGKSFEAIALELSASRQVPTGEIEKALARVELFKFQQGVALLQSVQFEDPWRYYFDKEGALKAGEYAKLTVSLR